MIPQKQTSNREFEKVPTDDFVVGKIAELQYDLNKTFKGFDGNPDKVMQGVRFRFELEGCKYPHYSKWMKMVWSDKSNIFKFVSDLVENCSVDSPFDLSILNGMAVKTLWSNKGEWQNLDKLRPVGGKIKAPKNGVPEIDLDREIVVGGKTYNASDLEPDDNTPF